MESLIIIWNLTYIDKQFFDIVKSRLYVIWLFRNLPTFYLYIGHKYKNIEQLSPNSNERTSVFYELNISYIWTQVSPYLRDFTVYRFV